MAQTFLVKAPKKNARGIYYRVVKDRSWDDMPWSYLVQKYKMNYSRGRDVWTWQITDKLATKEEAIKIFEKKTKSS